MLLGVIADDLTGATDVALMLSRNGMKTVQVIGVPTPDQGFGGADAVVVALKSRTIPAAEAVAMSLEAAAALRSAGAEQFLFKYCSTFDSTDAGNIGPVADALLEFLSADLTIACPAFPANGRSIYLGHLFVGQMLLSDSPMKDHPLTPMRDANLVRVLQRQVKGASRPDPVCGRRAGRRSDPRRIRERARRRQALSRRRRGQRRPFARDRRGLQPTFRCSPAAPE